MNEISKSNKILKNILEFLPMRATENSLVQKTFYNLFNIPK